MKTVDRFHFMIIPSMSCPASCSYCFGPNCGPIMDSLRIESVIRYIGYVIRQTGQRHARITLHGGEPLAAGSENLSRLIQGLSEELGISDVRIGVQSNLWLLDQRLAECFAHYHVSLSTSLDGCAELTDAQRGKGYFARTMAGINLARSNGIQLSSIATFTTLNAAHWQSVFDFFLAEGIPFCIHPSVPAIGSFSGLEITPEAYASLICDMFDYYVVNRKSIRVASFDQICQGFVMKDGQVCTFRDCFGMFLVIDPDGDIFSCQRLAGQKEYALGNISDFPDPGKILNSPAARKLLQRESDVRQHCEPCEFYRTCKGGCTYNALAGCQYPLDPYCQAYQSIFSKVKISIYDEMVSAENQKSIESAVLFERGSLLLRRGPVIELTDPNTSPKQTAEAARLAIAAYELGRSGTSCEAAARLAHEGIFRSDQAALDTLVKVRQQMGNHSKMNKLYLHVTWNCQLSCSHCYASAGAYGCQEDMAASDLVRLIREARSCGFREVVITGGEPLLSAYQRELLLALGEIRRECSPLKIVLRTNLAMPLSDQELAMAARAFDKIVVSIDGDESSHDRRRGHGAYQKCVDNLKSLIQISKTLESDCHHSLPPAHLGLAATLAIADVKSAPGHSVSQLAGQLGIRSVTFRPLLPLGRAASQKEGPIQPEALHAYLPPLEILKTGFKPVSTCGLGQNLYVEPSGDAFPCYACHDQESWLGNVLSAGLAKVIQGAAFQELQSYTVDTREGCRACNYRYLCGGSCRAWDCPASQRNFNSKTADCMALLKRAREIHQAALDYLEL